ncbi:MAG: DUF2723 domain-containing protein [Candidatus Cloacimonetes bacterium]|nr:DUF2723 domain-containing protein [Candidatus Cloacimonadota bacterium]
MNTTKKIDSRTVREMAKKKQGASHTEYQKPQPRLPVDDSLLRPQEIIKPSTNYLIAWLVFFATLIVYMLTQARTLSFWDSGEFASCISILGVPHPPGSPFYIIFGRALVTLFGGIFSHAVISAFISGLASALAVMFTYLITVQLVSMMRAKPWEAVFAGCISAFFTAFSFTFWMNAVEAEVYSGLVFFVNLIIWLTLRWVQNSRDMNRQNELLLIVYLFFLGFCVHQTALQIAPAILFIVVYPLFRDGTTKPSFWPKVVGYTVAIIFAYFVFGTIGHGLQIDDFDKWGFALTVILLLWFELKDEFDPRLWLLAAALLVVGVSSHLYLLIRAEDRPFINEGHPGNLKMFMDYVLRKQYGETSFFIRRASFFKEQMGFHFFRYLGQQFFDYETLVRWVNTPAMLIKSIGTAIVGLLTVLGAYLQAKKNRHSFFYLLSLILCTTILMVFVINLSNQEVRDRDYFFVVGYNMLLIWTGIGAMGVLQLANSKAAKIAVVAIIGILPIFNMATQYHQHDRSREFIALDYGINFLNSVEENAIIFTNGDNDTFPIWYAQAVHDPHAISHTHPAKDVYPDAQSQAAIKIAMDFKNKTLKGIRKDVTVANLSLLNTPWYIRQLRDREGVLFNWTEEDIDDMFNLPVPRNLEVSAGAANPQMSFSIPLEETPSWRPNEYVYRMSDKAVMRIIQDNFGKRPIYFAVTCESMIGFEDYVRAEGMVNRVVHTQAGYEEQVDIVRLTQNIDEIYQYRSIGDKRVYKDDNMQRLVMNYAAAFSKAGSYYAINKELDKAWEYRNKAQALAPGEELKMIEFYVRYYANKGAWQDLDEYLNANVFPHPEGLAIYFRYVMEYLNHFDIDIALRYYQKVLLQYPDSDRALQFTVGFTQDLGINNALATILEQIKGQLYYDVQDAISYLRGELQYEDDQEIDEDEAMGMYDMVI